MYLQMAAGRHLLVVACGACPPTLSYGLFWWWGIYNRVALTPQVPRALRPRDQPHIFPDRVAVLQQIAKVNWAMRDSPRVLVWPPRAMLRITNSNYGEIE